MKILITHSKLFFIIFAFSALFVSNNVLAHCKVYHPHHCTKGKIGDLPPGTIGSPFQNKYLVNVMGRCLDVAGGVNANRTNVQIFDCNGSKSQKWSFNSRKEIRNVMGRCLDVAGGVNANRTTVQIFDCNGSKSQQWAFNSRKEIGNVMGRCLDVSGGINANRTNVQIFDCNGTNSQKWKKP